MYKAGTWNMENMVQFQFNFNAKSPPILVIFFKKK